MKSIYYKSVFILLPLIIFSSCYVTRPDATTTKPDYNSRVEVKEAHYDNELSPIGAGTIVAGTATGMYLGYKSSMFTHYDGAEKKKFGVGGMLIGGVLGFYTSKYINKLFGWKKVTYPNNPQEWINNTNPEYILTRQTDNRNFILTHKSAENKFLVKNFQDAKDFSVAFPNSQYTNNVCKQTINNSNFSRDNYFELLNLFPGNRYELDMKKKYVWYSPTVSSLFTAYDKFPETKLDIEFKGADLVSDYYDAKIFHNRFPKSIYNRKVVVKSLDNSSVSNIEKMAPMFGNDFYLTKYDFQKYSGSVSNIGKKNYSNALYEIKRPNTMLKLESFYHEYVWLQYTEKPNEIINNYWTVGNNTLSNGNDILGFINNLATHRSYKSWNISNSKVNNFLSEKLDYEINRNVNYQLYSVKSPGSSQWQTWVNNNNLTAGLVRMSNLSYLITGKVTNNSKFDLPLKITVNGQVYRTYKIQGTTGDVLEIFEVIGEAFDAKHRRPELNEKTDYIGSMSENYYIPNLKRNTSHTFAVVYDIGSKAGVNIADWAKLTEEIEIKDAKISDIEYYNYNLSSSTISKQKTWQNFASYGMPEVKLMDVWRSEEYDDEEWKQKWEWKKEQERLAAERRRREREREYDNYEKNYAEEERKKEEEREQERLNKEIELKAKNVNECISEMQNELVVNECYSSDEAIAYGDCSGCIWCSWTLTHVVEGTLLKSKGWYVYNMYMDDGPYDTKLEAITKYCKDKYE